MSNHARPVVHDSEDTREISEITRKRMLEKMKSPLCVENKVRIAPPDYSKENLLATFAPQRNLTPEQIFWSIDNNDRKKAETSVPKPLSALTVYPPNTPVKLVPRILPTKSQVKINLYVLTQLFTEFDKTCKTRITPTGITEGERGFEQTKRCYLTEVIPFFKTLKEHFVGVQTALFKEVKEMEEIFDQMNNEVDKNTVDKQCAEIEKKNLLIENENLIVNCLSTQLLYDVEKSRCLDLEADMSKVHDESKLISKLEREYLNLQLKYQHLQESFDNKNSQASQEAPDFNSFFKIKNLEHQIQEKDNVIRNLKDLVANVNDRSCEPYNAKDVTALIEQNDCDRVELEKVKQHYKELYDSIKITRAHTSEKTSTMLNEIESLKAQLRSKESCFRLNELGVKQLNCTKERASLETRRCVCGKLWEKLFADIGYHGDPNPGKKLTLGNLIGFSNGDPTGKKFAFRGNMPVRTVMASLAYLDSGPLLKTYEGKSFISSWNFVGKVHREGLGHNLFSVGAIVILILEAATLRTESRPTLSSRHVRAYYLVQIPPANNTINDLARKDSSLEVLPDCDSSTYNDDIHRKLPCFLWAEAVATASYGEIQYSPLSMFMIINALKWIYAKLKLDEYGDGTEKHKHRVVAKGYRQEEGLQVLKVPSIFINKAKYALETLKKYGMDLFGPLLIHPIGGSIEYWTKDIFGIPLMQIADHAGCQDSRRSTSGSAQFLEIRLNTMAEQNVPAQPPTRTDEQIVPRSQWLTIGKSNLLFNAQKIQKNPIFQISVDILSNTNFFQAFTASANVPAIYLQQFWKTMSYNEKTGVYSCQVDEQWFDLSADLLRKALAITPVNPTHPFELPPSGDTVIDFVNELGYPEPVEIVSSIRVNYVYQPWRAILSLLNQCLTGKTSGSDKPRHPVLQMLWGIVTQTNVDHAELIWEEFTQGIQTFFSHKASHKASLKNPKKKVTPLLIPYGRFSKVIIYYLASNNNIHRRPDSAVHHTGDDYILGNLKFVPKGESVEVFGMAIPDPLITEAIQQSSYYPKYLQMVAENTKKTPQESASVQPATKRATPKKPTTTTPVKQSKPAPPPTKKPSKRKLPQKIRKGKPTFQLVDEEDEARQDDDPDLDLAKKLSLEAHQEKGEEEGNDADLERAIKLSLDPVFLPQGRAPVGGVTIRDPVSEATPEMHEVVGKGKAVVSEEQVAHSLIDLSKKKRTTDQFILVRRDQTPPDSTTGPSSQPEDDTSEKVIHESSSTSDSERTESETETAAPKGDKDQGEVDSSTVTSGVSIPVSDPETPYPKVHENLKLITDERVIDDKPESHSGSMSSMKNLDDTFNFGDQFLHDKPTEDDQEKSKVREESDSTIPDSSHQTVTSTPPVIPPFTEVSSSKPSLLVTPPPINTEATTITTSLPEITPFIALQLRVARLEQEMSEVKKTHLSADVLASIRSQVPTAVDNYLGTKLDDALLKVLERHTADLIEKYSVLPGPESVKNQESEKSPKEIIKAKKEQDEEKQDSTYSIRSTDKVDLEEFDLKSALFSHMNKKKSANKNTTNYRLYHALMEALIADEDAMDKEVADKVKDHKRKHDSDDDEDDDDDEGPSAGSNQGRSTKKRRSDSAASGSAKPPPKADDQSSKKPRESEASASKQHPIFHLKLDGRSLTKRYGAYMEDTDNAHIPKVSTTTWFKPIPESERPATPEPEWTISPNCFRAEHNWANAYATTYKVPEENKLQRRS
ncbi:hypothetical protein Tco_0707288 [Tanacetum coccineum]|uniref:Uncharacterized protein n=1 Tax=Tanacetum coccineum TaxID=301880 RepID=A0ABQ4YAP1_9ASTR